MDPEIDFRELFSQFDTMLLGRGTYEAALERRGVADYGMRTYVFSRTLRQKDHSEVTVVADQANELLTALKKAPGKDIWLMGGGTLFRCLLNLGAVDTVEVAIIPVLLGAGIPMRAPSGRSTKLRLTNHRLYKKTGIVSLEYAVT
jgi:dihydrofolate reductase